MRDVQIVVTICPDNRPLINAPANINVNVGDTARFTVTATDADAGDVITLVSDSDPTVVLSSTFSGTNPVTADFEWAPPAAAAGNIYTVVFIAEDDACPENRVNYASTNIVVTAANCSLAVNGVVGIVTDAFCTPTGNITLSIDSAQLPLNTLLWTGPNGFVSNNDTITNLAFGDYTLFVRDARGCIITQSYFITGDTVPPVLSCLPDDTMYLAYPQCNNTYTFPALSYTDNCPATLQINQVDGLPSGSAYPAGVTLNRFIVEDEGRNRDSCEFTVTVIDSQNLVIHCPNDTIDYECEPGGVKVFYPLPTVSNGCLQTIELLSGGASGSLFQLGTNFVTFRAYNNGGKADTCTFRVIVKPDTVPPVIDCPADTVTAQCGSGVVFEYGQVPEAVFGAQTFSLYTLAWPSLSTLNTVTVIVNGNSTNLYGLATQPNTGVLYGIGYVSGDRSLITIDPATGQGTLVGPTGINSSDIHFGRDGKLYAVSGASLSTGTPYSLYELDVATGAATLLTQVITNGGKALGYCKDNGKIYHYSGGQFESIDPFSYTRTAISLSGSVGNAGAMTYIGNGQFLISRSSGSTAYIIDTAGVVTTYSGGSYPTSMVGLDYVNRAPIPTQDNCDLASFTQLQGLPSGNTYTLGVYPFEFVAADASGNTDTCRFTLTIVPDTFPPVIDCPSDTVVGQCGNGVFFQYGRETGLLYASARASYTLYTLNPSSLAPEASINVTVNGYTSSIYGIAIHPSTGVLYAVAQFSGSSNRDLITIDPATGIGTPVGPTGIYVSDIDFGPNGKLYAVSGNTGTNRRSLHELNLSTGAATLLTSVIANGGKALGFCTDNGKFYHYSAGQFESIDPLTLTRTSITVSGASMGDAGAMTYIGNGEFLISSSWYTTTAYTIDTAGVMTALGNNFPTYIGGLTRGNIPPFEVLDNCELASFTQTQGLPSGNTYTFGVHTFEFVAADAAGNTDTCRFRLTVTPDTFPPVIACPADTVVDLCGDTTTTFTYGQAPVLLLGAERTGDEIAVMDWPSLAIQNTINVTVNGNPAVFYALDVHPATGVWYGIGNGFTLISIDPQTGQGTLIGPTGVYVSDIHFGPNGKLYAVSGLAGSNANSLHELSLTTGAASLLTSVTYNGGKALGFCRDNGKFYHYTGGIYESIDPVKLTRTTITVSGDYLGNAGGMAYIGNGEFVISSAYSYLEAYVIDTSGVIVRQNARFPNYMSGLAFIDRPVLPITDNCDIASFTQVQGLPPGASYAAGVHPFLFVAADAAGNTDSCRFTLTVLADTVPPVITCPDPISVNSNPATCDAVIRYNDPEVVDNCKGVVVDSLPPQNLTTTGQNFTFTFTGVPSSITGNASLIVVTAGDIDGSSEYYSIYDENSSYLGQANSGIYCTPIPDTFTISPSQFALWAANGSISFVADASSTVDYFGCGTEFAQMTLIYENDNTTLTQIAGLSSGSAFPSGKRSIPL
ncbi:MAG: HYR domain-containing protein [Bacteroidia bacterium]